MKLLIATTVDDTHASIVKQAMDSLGHEATLWHTANIPQGQAHTLCLEDKRSVWLSDLSGEYLKQDYDAVWYRRPAHPKLLDGLHPDDVENAKKENAMFFKTFWQFILPDAFWINCPNAAARVSVKLLQLKIAERVGMKIPKTIVSNDPVLIENFIASSPSVVYKPLYPLSWITGNQINMAYTSAIDLHDLPGNFLLQSVPGIYQEKIEKDYELRVTYFGDKYKAVKIYSQEHDLAKLDWRSAPTKELRLEEVDLPWIVDKKCKELMREFNIVFGCFDFIVTVSGDYYFLEVNEQGQFLWVEEVNPDIKMLQSFVNFLLDEVGEKAFSSQLSLSDFLP